MHCIEINGREFDSFYILNEGTTEEATKTSGGKASRLKIRLGILSIINSL